MYVRPPNNNRERIKVPENYRGNVFASSGEYTDMPPPARVSPSNYDLPPERYERQNSNKSNAVEEQPEFPPQHREPYYDTTINDSRERYLPETREYEPDIKDERRDDTAEPVPKAEKESTALQKSSILSSLMPPSSNLLHFPFGHGLGSEELLILGIMLLVFLNGNETGEPDNEFLLLLALLLFAG